MIETFTKTAYSSSDENLNKSSIDVFSAAEQEFYNNIQPALDSILKNPSEEVVAKIMKFSKDN